MIYGFPTIIDQQEATLVVSATTVPEFDDFFEKLKTSHSHSISGFKKPDFLDLMANTLYSGYRTLPIIITHPNKIERDNFILEFGVTIIGTTQVVDCQIEMLNNKPEEEKTEEEKQEDNRTLAEIYGLTENDPWDRKTDEEKEEEKEMREEYEKAKKEGKLSGPFRAQGKDSVVIQDIRQPSLDDIRVTAIKFPGKTETPEEKEKRELIEIAGKLTPEQSKELATAVIYGSFSKEDYATKLKEYEKQRLEKETTEIINSTESKSVEISSDE